MNSFFDRTASHPPRAVAFIVLIGLLICFWDLGGKELFAEEGRRALCAQYYMQTGTYLVPEVHGEPYLNKPPGYPWMIVLSSFLFGGINEWSVRFPSACFTLITALLIYTFAQKQIPAQVRFLSTLIFFAMFEVVMKSRMGETDAALMCFVFASLWCWWYGRHSLHGYAWFISSSIMLACAMLMKGPPALVFFYAAVLTYCISQRQSKWLWSIQHAVFLSTLCFFTALWLIPFSQDISTGTLAETGSRELLRSSQFTLYNTISDQLAFTVGSILAFLPSSIILLFWCAKQTRKQHKAYWNEALFLIGMIITGFVFFFLFPETRIRYILPLAPAFSLITGMILFQYDKNRAPSWMYRILFIFWIVCCVTAFGGIVWGLIQILQPSPHGLTALSVMMFSGWLCYILIKEYNNRTNYPMMNLQIISVILLMFVINVEKINRHHQSATTKQLAQSVQSLVNNQTVYINYEGGFNFFYYVGAPVQRIDDISKVPANSKRIILAHIASQLNVETNLHLEQNRWEFHSTETVTFKNGNNLYLSTLIRTN